MDLVKVLYFLDLTCWELVLLSLKDAFVAENLLSSLLCKYLFRFLLIITKPNGSLVKGEWVEEASLPVRGVNVELVLLFLKEFLLLGWLGFRRGRRN